MLVLYFSGTGNSKYIAEQFAMRMNAPCYSIEENVDFESLLQQTETVAVSYPIYGSCVPMIMRKFVQQYLEIFQTKKLVIFCTQMLFSGDGARAFARLIPGCDKHVIYAEHFRMPNNICNFFIFPMREKELVQKPQKALLRIEEICKDIQNGVVKKRGWNVFSTLLGKAQNIAYPKIEQKAKSSFQADKERKTEILERQEIFYSLPFFYFYRKSPFVRDLASCKCSGISLSCMVSCTLHEPAFSAVS